MRRMDDFVSQRSRLNDPDFLQPWERLLLLINKPGIDRIDLLEAITLALPYCKETIEQRNERLRLEAQIIERQQPPPAPAPFDFGKLNSARDILRAQRKVLASLGAGLIATDLAHRYIGMLDALRRSHADVVTEDRLLDYEETRKSVEADLDRQSP
jgi:hypothetical protein